MYACQSITFSFFFKEKRYLKKQGNFCHNRPNSFHSNNYILALPRGHTTPLYTDVIFAESLCRVLPCRDPYCAWDGSSCSRYFPTAKEVGGLLERNTLFDIYPYLISFLEQLLHISTSSLYFCV